MRSRLSAAVPRLAVVGTFLAAGLFLGAGPAQARLPAHPAPCGFSFGQEYSEGAAGTQILNVPVIPASPGQSCLTEPVLSDEITDAAGAVPAGIRSDGGSATTYLLFAGREFVPPTIAVGWSAYCTDQPQSVYLRLSGGGQAAVYPLGISRPCSQGPGPSSAVQPPEVLAPEAAIGVAPSTNGAYRIATVSGTVFDEPTNKIDAGDGSTAPFVGIAADPNGGFWLATADGGVYSYDGAPFYGSTGGVKLAQPVVGIASTPTGHGYFLVAADGGVFGYGDARFHGSAAGQPLAGPVVGISVTSDGGGYWLAAADGGVFNYGDAHFYGSAGSAPLTAAIVGIAADGTTGGYWLVAADGGVFSFHAPFYGSAGGVHLAAPVTGLAADAGDGGYWLLGADGGVFTYGNAPYYGSATGGVDAGASPPADTP